MARLECRTRSKVLRMSRLTARRVRASLDRIVDHAADSHGLILSVGKRNSAVLFSAKDRKAVRETLYLLSTRRMRKSIRDAMAEPLRASVKELRW